MDVDVSQFRHRLGDRILDRAGDAVGLLEIDPGRQLQVQRQLGAPVDLDHPHVVDLTHAADGTRRRRRASAQPLAGRVGLDVDDDVQSIRSLLSRLVGQLGMWNAAIGQYDYDWSVEDHESVLSLRARLAVDGPKYLAEVRRVVAAEDAAQRVVGLELAADATAGGARPRRERGVVAATRRPRDSTTLRFSFTVSVQATKIRPGSS